MSNPAINDDDLEYLQLTGKRFLLLLELMASSTGVSPAAIVRQLDGIRAIRDRVEERTDEQFPEVIFAPRKKQSPPSRN